jgi:predicted enzyme related to lactoylglutathione lyase
MAEGDRYIPGVPCWTDTTRQDPDAAGAFYSGVFGWELENVMPEGSGMKYLEATLGGKRVAAISGAMPGTDPTPAWNTYVWVESADDTAANVKEAGGTVVTEPMDVMDAGRMATFNDPEGANFGVWQPNEHRGAEVVNEHGSVNFHDLNTRDPEAAAAFYGAVFGWEALAMEGGFSMWTLPGYGDFLEQINPGTKARNEELGAPEGFVDVVASIAPISDDDSDTPAHWSLTFAVDDADAAAAKAEELGGTIVMPPTDMPWVRMTVINDPEGAMFVASKFVPENAA